MEFVLVFLLGALTAWAALRAPAWVHREGVVPWPLSAEVAAILAEAGYPEIPPDPPKLPDLELWRSGPWAASTGLLPTAAVLHFADRKKLDTIARIEAPYLAILAADIFENGIREPLILVMDVHGDVCLKEGHHRLTIARNFGISELPVRIRQNLSPGIRQAYHRSLAEMVPYFK